MENKKTMWRLISIVLVLLGAILIFLATEAWAGAVLIVLGVSIEVASIAMRHK
jgi:5-bromo-4-chloroindolyl phosphate hydrolysis protein